VLKFSPESSPEWLRLFVMNLQMLRLPRDLAYRAVAIDSRTRGCAVEIASRVEDQTATGKRSVGTDSIAAVEVVEHCFAPVISCRGASLNAVPQTITRPLVVLAR